MYVNLNWFIYSQLYLFWIHYASLVSWIGYDHKITYEGTEVCCHARTLIPGSPGIHATTLHLRLQQSLKIGTLYKRMYVHDCVDQEMQGTEVHAINKKFENRKMY